MAHMILAVLAPSVLALVVGLPILRRFEQKHDLRMDGREVTQTFTRNK